MVSFGALLGLTGLLFADTVPLGPDQVVISGASFEQLLGAHPDRETPRAWASSRELRLTVEPDGIRLRGRWALRAHDAPLLVADLLPANAQVIRATWDERPVALWAGDGTIVVAGRVDAPVALEVDAFLPGAGPGTELSLLEATTGTVRIESPEVLEVVADDSVVLRNGDRFVTGARGLRLVSVAAPAPETGPVFVAHAGLGLTVDDGVVTTHARVTWELRRGAVERLTLTASGFGADLDLSGAAVARWTRTGDEIAIELHAPTTAPVTVDLLATTPIPDGAETQLPLPRLGVTGAFRVESVLTIARVGDVDAVPVVSAGHPVAPADVPAWGAGLVTGAPNAAFRINDPRAGGHLACFRFVPVAGPPVRVALADLVFATAGTGEALLRARYEVVNERAAVLGVTPPPGARLVGAWVAGRSATPSRFGEQLRIPLKRSVDTAEGPLTFPVVLVLATAGERWSRREERELALPRVAAPVDVAQITVRLPRRYRSLLEPGKGTVVDRFSRAGEVAFGLADDADVARADALYADALDAWNENDFERAQQRLDELDGLGAQSENQVGLARNLALVRPQLPPASAPRLMAEQVFEPPPPADADSRRIRAQARARTGKHKATQREAVQRARKLRQKGDYDAAAEAYSEAIDESQYLYQFDEQETTANASAAAELFDELDEVKKEKAQREELESSSKHQLWSGGPFGGSGSSPAPLAPPPAPPAVVPLPAGGEAIHYELLLLEADSARTVAIRARRRHERQPR